MSIAYIYIASHCYCRLSDIHTYIKNIYIYYEFIMIVCHASQHIKTGFGFGSHITCIIHIYIMYIACLCISHREGKLYIYIIYIEFLFCISEPKSPAYQYTYI